MVTKIINTLSEKEQTILRMSFGIGYDREYEVYEISQVINLCAERVRQLKNKALEKLKEEYKKELNKI
jgi:RNA polymerase primary sigma factor